MARRGLEVSHEEIAREAGTGMGTIYRRFPAKQDLLDALFNEHIDAVVALAEDALGATDPWDGLQQFMERHLDLQAEDRGLSEMLRANSQTSELVRQARQRITPIVSELVERAHAAGELGHDVSPGDFVLVQLMVCGVMDAARSFDPELWRRALAVALIGLRQGQALPGTSPDADAIDRLHGGGAPDQARLRPGSSARTTAR